MYVNTTLENFSKYIDKWIELFSSDTSKNNIIVEPMEFGCKVYEFNDEDEYDKQMVSSRDNNRTIEEFSFDRQKIKEFRYDKSYMKMAQVWAQNSYAQRNKVGALLVKDNMIISDGFNGTPSGFSNICETPDGKTKQMVLHAEANCLMKVAKSHNSSDGSTLYVTLSPCIECAKMIIQAGVKRVVFGEMYRDAAGIDLLLRTNKITIQQMRIV